jgi:hypothetical protein
MQRAIAKRLKVPKEFEPPAPAKAAYGTILLRESAQLFNNLDLLGTCHTDVDSAALPSMEELGLW